MTKYIPADKVQAFEVSTVQAYRDKLEAAKETEAQRLVEANAEVLEHTETDGADLGVGHSRLPSEVVNFPPIRVVVDMWRIVDSPAARPAPIAA